MRCFALLAIAITLGFGLTEAATASDNIAQQTVVMRVLGSIRLAPSRNNVSITFSDVAPAKGLSPNTKTDSTTSLNWSLNIPIMYTSKITAEISSDCTPDITCKAMLAKPTESHGKPTGLQILNGYAVDMMTGIKKETCSNAVITYEVSLSNLITDSSSKSVAVIWTITEASN